MTCDDGDQRATFPAREDSKPLPRRYNRCVCAARVAGKTLRLPGPRINRAANDASTNAETTEPFLSCPAVGNPGCETANARAWGGIGERRNLVSQQDLELVPAGVNPAGTGSRSR